MTIRRTPGGRQGARPLPAPLLKALMPIMERIHRRSGDRFRGSDLLYLTTVGARTGRRRTTPVARFDDGRGGWLIVASFGGAARHPGWYHNIAANPGHVWAEVQGVIHHVTAEQLAGSAHDDAWADITARSRSFVGYRSRTDRHIPVLRLTRTPPAQRPSDTDPRGEPA